MSNLARRTAVQIFFDGVDITDSISNDLLSVKYTDNEEDETDDLQIKLQDRDGVWLNKWIGESVSAAAGGALQQANSEEASVYMVTAKIGLNVRSGRGVGYSRIGGLAYGSKVTVREIVNEWATIQFSGKTGYVSAKYLKKESDTVEQTATATKATGLVIRACILSENWDDSGNAFILDCGQFELDNVEPQGPPSTLTIKATSLPFTSTIRQTKKTKAWEAYTLSGIADEIARKNGMASLFESAENPYYSRVEQYDKSDIEFLSILCHNAGMSLKVSNNIIIIFDQALYEKKEVAITLEPKNVEKYKLKSGKAQTEYASCRVSYTTTTGAVITGLAYVEDYDADKKSNQQLEIYAKVKSIAEAKALAQKQLRLHNKYELTASFTVAGDPRLVAGITAHLKGWGYWDGKYIVSKAEHSVSGSGYSTSLTLRKALEGY